MADFYRKNGNAGTIGTFQSFVGKNLLAIGAIIKNAGGTPQDLRTEVAVNLAVPAILQALSANVTVLAYQFENTSAGAASFLLEGAYGYANNDIRDMIRGAGASAGNNAVDTTGTTVTNVGFKLATS
jgi:hypothetical protein